MMKKKIAVIGLGYVGLPLLIELNKKFSVIGYDIDKTKIYDLKNGIDTSGILIKSEKKKIKKIKITSNEKEIKQANIFIVCVPTPINNSKKPDLSLLRLATKTVGRVLKEKDLVIFESTVYPGVTDEICIPALEKQSNLVCDRNLDSYNRGKYFYCAYSPERMNPGDKIFNIKNVKKVISGSSKKSLQIAHSIYSKIIPAGVYHTSSIKVAEAAKIIENTQRDVNIALINELSVIFKKLNINTKEVIEAASTKWNFSTFWPGLVGGHCIGVDPYYLTFKSNQLGYKPKMILAGRKINDDMSHYVAKIFIKNLNKKKIRIKNSNILILGLTFKENVADLRNSKVFDLIRHLKSKKANIFVYDPLVRNFKAKNFVLLKNLKIKKKFDGIILTVAHKEFLKISSEKLKNLSKQNKLIFDLRNVLPEKITELRL